MSYHYYFKTDIFETKPYKEEAISRQKGLSVCWRGSIRPLVSGPPCFPPGPYVSASLRHVCPLGDLPISHLSKSFCTTIKLPFKRLFGLEAELLATCFCFESLMRWITVCCLCSWNVWLQRLVGVFHVCSGTEQPLDAEDNHSWDSDFRARWVGCGRLWHTRPHHVGWMSYKFDWIWSSFWFCPLVLVTHCFFHSVPKMLKRC